MNTAMKNIHMVDYEGRDFKLTISVEETTIMHGEDFVVDIRLKNQSGEDVVLYYTWSPFIAHIEGWLDISFPIGGSLNRVILKNGEFFHETRRLHSRGYGEQLDDGWPRLLPKGNHELRVYAFSPFADTLFPNQCTLIWSNTVILTVQ